MEASTKESIKFHSATAAMLGGVVLAALGTGIMAAEKVFNKPIQGSVIDAMNKHSCQNNRGIEFLHRNFMKSDTFYIRCKDGATFLEVSIVLREEPNTEK